ncbi:ABC transporter substrate-binding protein [Streptomyces telluris]|uniref:ABC transporter substrate-binding protein n=1 Tax=Streptomyces telluris TaxID=2720021 RepID=UPI001438F511|nr:iron-siderophore ABC transporter substrate-binding protein [Streptomyces telluris]
MNRNSRRGPRRRPRRSLPAAALVVAAVALGPSLSACTSGSGDGPGGGTHLVRTAMGEVKVKKHPQRVVVLDTAELDSAVTLGIRPVGATRADTANGFPEHLPAESVRGTADVGRIGAPDLEAVAALKPDLILTNKDRDAQRYDQLSKIAPTVMTAATGYPWKDNFRTHAEALGKTSEARKAVAAYETHAREVTGALGGTERAAALKVNVVRFVEGAAIRIYGRKNFIGTVLQDAGVGRPDVVDRAKDGFSYDVGPEQIDRADADALFTSVYGNPDRARVPRTTGSALWKGMKAVREGRTFKVDDRLWIQGIGYTAAHRILDELRAHLAD